MPYSISELNYMIDIQSNNIKDIISFIYQTIHNEINNPNKYQNKIDTNNIPNDLRQFRYNYYS